MVRRAKPLKEGSHIGDPPFAECTVYRPGSMVFINGKTKATVLEVLMVGLDCTVRYKVGYFVNETHQEIWLDEYRVTSVLSEDDLSLGFHAPCSKT